MNHKRVLGIGILVTVLAVLVGTSLAIAQQGGGKEQADAKPLQSPLVISYQGRLLDANGQPVTDPHDVAVASHNAPSGGMAVWADLYTLDFEDGYFSVQLGVDVPFPSDIFDGSARLLAVSINGEAEMEPRIPIGSVPYALRADAAATSPWAGLTGVPAGFADGIDDVGGGGGDSWLLAGNAGNRLPGHHGQPGAGVTRRRAAGLPTGAQWDRPQRNRGV